MSNYEPPPPEKGKYRLLNRMVGPLPPGKFEIGIEQKYVGGEEGSDSRYIEVTGPRFTLPLFDVHSVYPSRNEQDATTHCYVPFITLQRRTLPWDRSPFLPNEVPIENGGTLSEIRRDYPWVALLVFTEEELNSETQIHKSSDGLTLENVIPDYTVRTQMGITSSMERMTVDAISPSALHLKAVLPALDELLLLTHARQVNPMDKENCGDDADGWFSIVISNRVLVPDKTYHACLVSLEGKISSLYKDLEGLMNTPSNDHEIWSADPVNNSNLVLLHHWTFKSSPVGGDFQSRMERLQVRLRSSLSSEKSQGDLIPINLLKETPTEYLVDGGGQTGASLFIDTGTLPIIAGQTLTIDGDTETYTVETIVDAAAGFTSEFGTTVTQITFTPALASEPDDDALITFEGDVVEPLLLGNESVPGMTANSYLMTEMHGSDGLKEDVVYRGPFTSYRENHVPKEAPYQTSDGALAIVQELGIWDISHASAFELGRLLALSDARFTKALKRWIAGMIGDQQQQRANEEKGSRELDIDILAADTFVEIFGGENSPGGGGSPGVTLDYLNLDLSQSSVKVKQPPDLSDVYNQMLPDGGDSDD